MYTVEHAFVFQVVFTRVLIFKTSYNLKGTKTVVDNKMTCFHFQSQYIFNSSVENSYDLFVNLSPLKFCNISDSLNAISKENSFLGGGSGLVYL